MNKAKIHWQLFVSISSPLKSLTLSESTTRPLSFPEVILPLAPNTFLAMRVVRTIME